MYVYYVCVCVLCTAASKLFVLHVLRLCWLLDSTQWGRGNTHRGASHRLYVVGRVEADFAAFAALAPALLVLVLKLFELVPCNSRKVFTWQSVIRILYE